MIEAISKGTTSSPANSTARIAANRVALPGRTTAITSPLTVSSRATLAEKRVIAKDIWLEASISPAISAPINNNTGPHARVKEIDFIDVGWKGLLLSAINSSIALGLQYIPLGWIADGPLSSALRLAEPTVLP